MGEAKSGFLDYLESIILRLFVGRLFIVFVLMFSGCLIRYCCLSFALQRFAGEVTSLSLAGSLFSHAFSPVD